ncbi:MAG TPA: serine/threonine-protein kinase, partial [bacterium]|nr:serine/threonine-protein kinase [bacterium]
KFISMEYFHGKQLKEMISDQGFFNLEIGIDVLLDICNGLSAAHKLGIIHRDIKSQNLMISDDGVVKILDFGIAKSLDIPGLTVESAILGTPEYMSPEAIRQKPVDARSDIYSLGIVMYEIFTGRLPFICENFLSVIHCHLHEEPPPPRQFNPTLPEELVEVIMICLEKNPEDRYHSVAELAAELKMIRASLKDH